MCLTYELTETNCVDAYRVMSSDIKQWTFPWLVLNSNTLKTCVRVYSTEWTSSLVGQDKLALITEQQKLEKIVFDIQLF